MKKYYYARWLDSSNGGQLGNVSFFARSDAEAKTKADRIGRDIGLPRSRRTLHENNRLVQDRPYLQTT